MNNRWFIVSNKAGDLTLASTTRMHALTANTEYRTIGSPHKTREGVVNALRVLREVAK